MGIYIKDTEVTALNVLSKLNVLEKSIIERTIDVGYSDSLLTSLKNYAFIRCESLPSVDLPNCTTIGNHAFYHCIMLSHINIPACTLIGTDAFGLCTKLSSVNPLACTELSIYAFSGCMALSTISLPACTLINNYAFSGCRSLMSVYLMGNSVCTLSGSIVFTNTPMLNSTYTGAFGSIFVPASLLTQYQSATNWATLSSRFVGI